ncbi:Dyp-type peroxidase [Nesterenkonia muleiensis]|uniref:Dyp-type peroxidase n=1 Tax=Nesterenkonia muleiensis TaxID=2282648 RepID=UPI000E76D981|nr:Dyp-type peroxidase [Nesterenkonia muleiensis]
MTTGDSETGPQQQRPQEKRPAPGVSRRGFLLGSGAGVGVGAAASAVLWRPWVTGDPTAESPGRASGSAEAGRPVDSRGRHQAGVDRPQTPQANALFVIADVPKTSSTEVFEMLANLGEGIDSLTDPKGHLTEVLPDDPGDLVITVGIGPQLVSLIDPDLPGAEPLPEFGSDTELEISGGDVLLALYATDVTVLHSAAMHLLDLVPDASVRWVQAGHRGPGEGTVARNPFGYHDGVVVPRTDEELAENVWIQGGPAAGGTVCVLRRMSLDVSAFRALGPGAQDAVFGRHRDDGRPMSGGSPTDEVDLTARTETGDLTIPLRAHARAAHPSFTGSPLMLRRSYGFAEPDTLEEGMVFVCFQNDLEAFVRTQHRMDETDDLMNFVTTTASASFLILPGRTGDQPLGSSLRS